MPSFFEEKQLLFFTLISKTVDVILNAWKNHNDLNGSCLTYCLVINWILKEQQTLQKYDVTRKCCLGGPAQFH